MKSPITYAKIVATPTLSAWSQAYNAGNLAAVIALNQETIENQEGQPSISTNVSLASLGKELLNTLEAEYFTIETKNLNSIKQAITTTCEKVDEGIDLSLVVSVIIENILYVFIYGSGKILMKRSGKLGTLLEQKEKGHLTAASGFIQSNDIVILETEQFANVVSTQQLLPCLEHDKLTDMAEILAPVIHENQGGAAAALAFSYREEETTVEKENFIEVTIPTKSHNEKASEKPLEEEKQPDEKEEEPHVEENPEDQEGYTTKDYAPRRTPLHFSHSRKIILTVAVIIVIVLGFSIFFALQKQKEAQVRGLYQSTVTPAQKKFDEGQGLIDLNSSLARQDFQDAKNMLNGVSAKFPKGSNEEKQVNELMQKIDDELSTTSQINTVEAKEAAAGASDLLSALIKHTDAQYAAIDDTNIYLGNNDGITAITKKTGKEKIIITNKSAWKAIGGLGAYIGNVYVVDRQDGILKYIGGADSGKANYFSGTSPDLSKVTSMAIDGSVWLVTSDGTLSKYTRGKPDDFSIKGLDKPFNNPTRIATSVDMDNLYILDRGNKRIVVLDKSGNYKAQYQTGLLGNAQDIDPVEKSKLIYFLAQGKIYQLDLK